MQLPDPDGAARAALLDRLIERLAEIEPGARDAPDAVRVVRAPGRVNLIGEHTDYNLGLVMPVAISLETWIASLPAEDSTVRLSSLQATETHEFDVTAPGLRRGTWIDYVAGVATVLGENGVALRGLRGVIESDIPPGSGLSSSAALELAAAWTLSAEVPPPLSPMALARAAQRAENSYVGVQCGLMDQFASSHGQSGRALLLDCLSLDHEAIELPAGHSLVALDTRSPHRLGDSEYNARRAQCERGVEVLSRRFPTIRSLRDVTHEMLGDGQDLLGAETMRRCEHVVGENERVALVADALRAGDLEAVGALFSQSHASLRDLYDVSSPELDALVEIASAVPGVAAARMTGAGFGGCTVNIVHDDAIDDLRSAVAAGYPRRAGREAGFYVVQAVAGAGLVEA
jgi:galactokinase